MNEISDELLVLANFGFSER